MFCDSWLLLGLCLGLCFQSGDTRSAHKVDNSIPETSNDRPIIGVLAQEIETSWAIPDKQSYIAASYVKFIEGAGARTVPIKINQPDVYYRNMFASINGLLIPGGSADLETSGYAKAGAKLYNMAIAANKKGDYFPIFGVCLGFELLSVLGAGDHLTACSSVGRALPLTFQPAAKSSRLYGNAPEEVLSTLASSASTANSHHWCLTPENFTTWRLDSFYDIAATSQDDNGLTFIASIEARNYPIWGLQFHPEKPLYEWNKKFIPHSYDVIDASQYFADFLVAQARRSGHTFSSQTQEDKYLIYNYQPIFTRNVTTGFEQCYFFD